MPQIKYLTPEVVKRIREHPEISGADLAREFGCCGETVYKVRRYDKWRKANFERTGKQPLRGDKYGG